MSDSNRIADLLAYDALSEAERITGESYKNDESTSAIGFGLHLMHARDKEAALAEAHDSHFRMDLADILALFADLGFEEVLCDDFKGTARNDEPAPAETFRILWHADGLLATVESYGTTGHNMSKVYYNLKVTDETNLWSRTSSGHFADGVWVGDHDAREGIRTKLSRLREVGDFLPVWVERPFLWLVNYAETKRDGYDYAAINKDRISRLPENLRKAIGGAA